MARRNTRLALWRGKPLRAVLGDVANFVLFTARRFVNDGMTQAAGALTFSTLLALVPLLVIVFSILSGFSAFDAIKGRIEDLVLSVLVPEVGADARIYLADFTRNAGDLTAVGIVALALAAVLLLSTIESTLNQIWKVEIPRPITTRLLIFWAILTVGPLLLGASFAVSSEMLTIAQNWAWGVEHFDTSLASSRPLKTAFAIATQSAAFTLLFRLVPARHVNWRDATMGGVFAGAALQGLRWAFNLFLTSSATYTTIYGAIAIFPIFLLWLYSCWTVIILGAVLAASFPDWWHTRDPMSDAELAPPDRLAIAVALLSVLHRKSIKGGTVSQDRLADTVPLDARDDIVEALRAAEYIVSTEDERYSLSRDLHRTSVAELARDIGLSLGLSGGATADRDRVALSRSPASLTVILSRLATVEDDVLGVTLAELFEDRDKQPEMGGNLTAVSGPL